MIIIVLTVNLLYVTKKRTNIQEIQTQAIKGHVINILLEDQIREGKAKKKTNVVYDPFLMALKGNDTQ